MHDVSIQGLGRGRFRNIRRYKRRRVSTRSAFMPRIKRRTRRYKRLRKSRPMKWRQLFRAKKRPIPGRKGPGRARFLRWLKVRHSKLYKTALNKFKISRRLLGRQISGTDIEKQIAMAGLGSDLSGVWGDFMANLGKAIPVIAMTYQQRAIFKANLKRAKQGLPPLNPNEIAPSIKIEADIGAETTQRMSGELQKFIVPGLVIGGLIFALKAGK